MLGELQWPLSAVHAVRARQVSDDFLKISVVIPNYNSGPVIERALTSIAAQNYPNLELILADGGSTDESIRICRARAERFALIISEKDEGIADALNKGFAKATGELFGWLAADDELAPGALHHWNELFRAHPEVDVITGACLRIYEDGSKSLVVPRADVMERIGFTDGIEQPSTMWRAALHRKVAPLDTSFKLAFDWDLWCRFRNAGARLMPVSQLMSHYHFSATNLTSSSGERVVGELFRVTRKHGPWFGLIAYVYLGIFRCFDMRGCFDKPKTCSMPRRVAFNVTLGILYVIFTRRLIKGYSWKYASRQIRGLVWYRR